MATFAISAVTRKAQATANGSTTEFAFSFSVNTEADVAVFVGTTLKTISTHYTVSITSSTGAGSITFTSGNTPTNGQIVTIMSKTALARSSVYTSGGTINATSLETDFDTNMMLFQQQDERLDRVITAPVDDATSIDMTLPNKDARKGTVLGFNATSGNPEAGPSITAVQSLADVTTAINLLGTSAVVEDMGLLGTAAVVEDMGLLANSTTIANMAQLGTSAAVADMALLGTSAVVADMAILGTSDVVADMNTLATSDIISDLNTLATSDIVTDMNLLATSANVAAMGKLGLDAVIADMALLGTDAVVADLAILGTTDVVADMNTLATSDIVSDMNTLATSANVTAMGLLGTSAVVTDMGLLGTAAVVEDMGILGTSANVTAMSNVSGSISDVNTVATNLSGITAFSAVYSSGGTDPSSNLNEGDLFFNTSSDALKVYNGSAWVAGVTVGSGFLPLSGGTMTGNLVAGDNVKATFGAGSDLEIYHRGDASFIDDVGTGNLNIRAENLNLANSDGSENYIRMAHNGAVELYHDNSKKFETTATGVLVTGNVIATGTVEPAGDTAAGDNAAIGYTAAEGLILTGQGSTSDITLKNDADAVVFTVPTGTDDILFPDNAKAMFGAGSDLQIYHDSGTSNSFIDEQGSGNLIIRGTNIQIKNSVGADMADFTANGAARLFFSNAAKLATTSTGVDVTGNVVVSGTVDGVDLQTLNTAVSANTSKTTNATHSGEVTGSGALTIADNVVDEANLKVSNSPTNGYMLTAQSGNTGGLTWAAAGGGAMEFINTTDISNAATYNFTAFDSSKYDAYVLYVYNVIPATNGSLFHCRTSTDGGSNYDSTSGDYGWSLTSKGAGEGAIDHGYGRLASATGNETNESGISLTITIFAPHLAKPTMISSVGIYNLDQPDVLSVPRDIHSAIVRQANTDVDGFRMFFSSGNIREGTVSAYGVVNS